jgi:hypothetical protein
MSFLRTRPEIRRLGMKMIHAPHIRAPTAPDLALGASLIRRKVGQVEAQQFAQEIQPFLGRSTQARHAGLSSCDVPFLSPQPMCVSRTRSSCSAWPDRAADDDWDLTARIIYSDIVMLP